MAMPPIDDDNLPEGLQADLHRLLPTPPADLAAHERAMLDQAHLALARHGRGRSTGWRWLTATSAVAAMLLLAIALFHSHRDDNPVVPIPAPVVTVARPTIIDAMVAARRAGAKQADVDQIAMAAVTLDAAEVR